MTEEKLADELLGKIKANQPIEKEWVYDREGNPVSAENQKKNEDTDFLEIIPKGNMILQFLDSISKKEEVPIQMIALYGEWGSGKTSLMRYIEKNLAAEKFSKVFFEAWKLENDENLALSLLDCVSKANKGNTAIYKDKASNSLKKITKSALSGIKTPLYDVGKAFDTARQEFENKSFSDAVDTFEDSYIELETAILNDTKGINRKLIVFIDDLDRCEPENVLNLLSAIKLFFTLGNRTIFLCGLDEKAVDEAVKVKYREVVKSGEYMEKIFDISFDMPKHNINKIISYYLEDMPDAVDGVQEFFEAMHFTNPRRLKKVLNKYLLIRYYQASGLDKDGLIPDQNIAFFRYLTLFIIMLYKFESDNFEMLRDYDAKLVYLRNHKDEEYAKTVNRWKENEYALDRANTYTFGNMVKILKDQRMHIISCLAVLFGNKIDNYRVYDYGKNGAEYIDQFLKQSTKNGAFVKYCGDCFNMFLKSEIIAIKNSRKGTGVVTLSDIGENLSGNNYVLWNIFDMAERYL